MQPSTFLQLYEHHKCNYASGMDVHTGMPYKFNHYMHACFAHTVHDTKNLTFSADYRTDNPLVAVQPSAYIRADN